LSSPEPESDAVPLTVKLFVVLVSPSFGEDIDIVGAVVSDGALTCKVNFAGLVL
jgi:hypothetical protein